jgi:hypothetical protein
MLQKILLALLLVVTMMPAQSGKVTDQYLVSLPSGWMQVPADGMDLLTQDLKFTAVPHADQKFSYLYQRISRDSLFTLPYILVQVNDAPRMTAKELKSFGTKNFNLDPATNILWGLRDSTLEVIIPTSHGSINVFCYSSKRDYRANKEQFVEIIRSMRLQPPFVYQESVLRDLPLVDYIFRDYRVNGLLITLFIAMLIVARLRVKK